jgi:hypothetical protein
VVKDTGAFTGDLKVKYDAISAQLTTASYKMTNYVNEAVFPDGKMNAAAGLKFGDQVKGMLAERQRILATPEFKELKNAVDKEASDGK